MKRPSNTPPVVARKLASLRRTILRWRAAGDRIALVPTMGALHAGHLALVRLARRRAARVIVSIFVNPAQFAPSEDFAAYPRTFAADVEALREAHADAVWAPAVADMYPDGFAVQVVPAGRRRSAWRTPRGRISLPASPPSWPNS